MEKRMDGAHDAHTRARMCSPAAEIPFFSSPHPTAHTHTQVKTQIQKMKADPATGKMPFTGPVDCALKTLKSGGPLKFYTGFPTYIVRIAPHGASSRCARLPCLYAPLLRWVQGQLQSNMCASGCACGLHISTAAARRRSSHVPLLSAHPPPPCPAAVITLVLLSALPKMEAKVGL